MNARYRRQKGADVLFTQGWDCHGLPTEVKVEETHGIKKNDVSRTKFREYCVDLTIGNISKMKAQMRAMGYSQDWTREFVTMTPEYMRKTQYSFLKMYEDGLIYQGIHPVNWCPRCETAIAFAEVEYSDNTTFLNYVNFTTPWVWPTSSRSPSPSWATKSWPFSTISPAIRTSPHSFSRS